MKKLFTVVALAVGAGLSGASLLGALVTGSVDNPMVTGGVAVIRLSENVLAFWASAALFLFLSIVLAVSAYSVAKGRS